MFNFNLLDTFDDKFSGTQRFKGNLKAIGCKAIVLVCHDSLIRHDAKITKVSPLNLLSDRFHRYDGLVTICVDSEQKRVIDDGILEIKDIDASDTVTLRALKFQSWLKRSASNNKSNRDGIEVSSGVLKFNVLTMQVKTFEKWLTDSKNKNKDEAESIISSLSDATLIGEYIIYLSKLYVEFLADVETIATFKTSQEENENSVSDEEPLGSVQEALDALRSRSSKSKTSELSTPHRRSSEVIIIEDQHTGESQNIIPDQQGGVWQGEGENEKNFRDSSLRGSQAGEEKSFVSDILLLVGEKSLTEAEAELVERCSASIEKINKFEALYGAHIASVAGVDAALVTTTVPDILALNDINDLLALFDKFDSQMQLDLVNYILSNIQYEGKNIATVVEAMKSNFYDLVEFENFKSIVVKELAKRTDLFDADMLYSKNTPIDILPLLDVCARKVISPITRYHFVTFCQSFEIYTMLKALKSVGSKITNVRANKVDKLFETMLAFPIDDMMIYTLRYDRVFNHWIDGVYAAYKSYDLPKEGLDALAKVKEYVVNSPFYKTTI